MTSSLEGKVRDFIYLDIDRLRSFVAQLHEGVPDIFTQTSGQEKSGKGEVAVEAPFLVKAGIGGNILYQKTTSETKSAHHYLYSMFEQNLDKANKLTRVDANFPSNQWIQSRFSDGVFVLVSGRVQIIDYNNIVAALESLPRIVEIGMVFNRQTLKQQLIENKISQKEYESQLKSTQVQMPNKKEFEGITEIVQKLYSGFSRVKVFPLSDQRHYCFVGNVPNQYFSSEQLNPFVTCGLVSGTNWSVMGLVNESSDSPLASTLESGDNVEQSLEDVLESLVVTMKDISKMTLSTKFPAISILPIAIYRSC